MKIDLINNIIDLRAAVSFLGEKKSWWNSNFHDSSSKDFLTYILPKSKNTQFSCSNVSSRHFTDNEVGANYYHLFRLPMSVEELVDNNEKSATIHSFESEENAKQSLMELATNLSVDSKGGPKNIGSSDQLDNELLQVFAAEYLNAFENDYQVHPYLN
tara:strand:- start:1065 stop:1538 length:474 start_codon:yes stop_codon:yes gene_type:complete